MIEFLTLFLGLTLGPQQLEMTVTEPVAAVEIQVDGKTIANIDKAPWRLGLDFGDHLVPQRLTAVGFDAAGEEVARVTQNINFGRSNHEANIVLLEDQAGGAEDIRGRVIWKAPIQDQKPKHIEVRLDGSKLNVNDSGYFTLPPQTRDDVHVLEAAVTFPPVAWTDATRRVPLASSSGFDFEGSMASRRQVQRPAYHVTDDLSVVPSKTVHAHLVFGKLHGPGTAASLTAIPVRMVPGFDLPSGPDMNGWFADRDGQSLPVFSIGEDLGGPLVVYDHALRKRLASIVKQLSKDAAGETLPLGVRPGHSVRFVATQPYSTGNVTVYPSYETAKSQVAKGFLPILADPPTKPKSNRLPSFIWDSLALAGRRAAQTNQVRAVVAILDEEPNDQSSLRPDQAFAYLAALRVPLFIWTPTASPTMETLYGASRYFGDNGLLALADDLGRTLDRQRIVWVEGEPLPQQVRLTAEAPRTVSLIGPKSR